MPRSHEDSWKGLNVANSMMAKLNHVRAVLKEHMPFIGRIAIALYDKNTDDLRTFAHSSDENSPLNQYHAKLSECHSLCQITTSGRPRVVDNMEEFVGGTHLHASAVFEAGYHSSYTFPMFWENELLGFIFFNSTEIAAFKEIALHQLDAVSHMIALMVVNEKSNVETLSATVRSALQMTHSRDPETGGHLERMARYCRLIANNLAEQYHFSDHFIEHIVLFAPLHDLGKLTIPDRILLKAGPLSDEEFELMKTHSNEGRVLIDKLLENYGLKGVAHIEVLRNIVLHHHEKMDGSGYPAKLSGQKIPIEARIVTVADIFDALTSKRPYKEPWSNESAFERLQQLVGSHLDPDCVEALIQCREAIEQIQSKFGENKY